MKQPTPVLLREVVAGTGSDPAGVGPDPWAPSPETVTSYSHGVAAAPAPSPAARTRLESNPRGFNPATPPEQQEVGHDVVMAETGRLLETFRARRNNNDSCPAPKDVRQEVGNALLLAPS